MWKRVRKLFAALALMLLVLAAMNDGLSAQGKIIVTALPSNAAPKQGEVVDVPLLVDLAQTSFRLGAVTASLQWDSTQLAFRGFLPGASEGFADPVVNVQKTAAGKLLFASINALGTGAQANVFTLRLEARTDIAQWRGLTLDLITLASAESFIDLLPLVERVVTGVKAAEIAENLPARFALAQNVPNPFNPATTIRYELARASAVVLAIYNLAGQKIKTLEEGYKPAGRYSISWEGKDARGNLGASGIYFYRLEAKDSEGKKFTATRKMSLLR
jgi:hypothetical protein